MEDEKVLQPLEGMTLAQLREEAKGMGMHHYSILNKDELLNVLTVRRFISDRKWQASAIRKAQELKDITGGKWFTLRGYINATRPVELDEWRRPKKGKPTITEAEASAMVETLALFGLMHRKLRAGKQPQYKVKMEAAHKAIEAHNRMADATAIIEGKGGRIIVKG